MEHPSAHGSGFSELFIYRRVQFPTIVAPRKLRTWPIGFAIALVLLPA